MRTLGRYMAYYLKYLDAGRTLGVAFPELESYRTTNFIRNDEKLF